jgi:hypothetical protein
MKQQHQTNFPQDPHLGQIDVVDALIVGFSWSKHAIIRHIAKLQMHVINVWDWGSKGI